MSLTYLSPTKYIKVSRGQTALSLIFVIGGIVVLFAATLAFLAVSFLNSTYGFQAASRAGVLAEGAVQDAMLRLERDNQFSSTGYCLPYSASLPCPTGSAEVVVVQDSPGDDQVTVTAEATVVRYSRRVQAVFSVNSETGLVSLMEFKQSEL